MYIDLLEKSIEGNFGIPGDLLLPVFTDELDVFKTGTAVLLENNSASFACRSRLGSRFLWSLIYTTISQYIIEFT